MENYTDKVFNDKPHITEISQIGYDVLSFGVFLKIVLDFVLQL